MYDIYAIVKVEYCSYNKGEYFVSISHVISLSSKKEPKDEHLCITVHLHIDNN